MSALLPLELLRAGDWAEVVEVFGDAAWVGRMAELGLRPGCRLQILSAGSPCLLLINGTRLCLRAEQAMQVLVQPVSAEVPAVRIALEHC